ncbi:hypothetical protein HMPREF3224_00548 [Anaerococcus hydrogenalis]|nr:hypothetical protein HMPREF3224_00548 [Anaerococcus hydrogenalis]
MAKTIIEREFWNDDKIIDDYSPEDKLFMMYLLTCPRGNALGIFKLPIKLIAFEIGYSPEAVRTLVDRFMTKYNRINYDYKSQEIAIYRALKYTVSKGGKPIEDMMRQLLSEVTVTDNIIKVHEVMSNWWLKSNRPVDKMIKSLMEEEIEKRSAISNVNVNDYVNVNVNDYTYPVSYHDTSEVEDFNTPSSKSESYNDRENDTSNDTWNKQVIDTWNSLDKNIPRIQTLNVNTQRYQMLKARINEHGLDTVIKAIKSIDNSKFLKGYVSDFRITIDWFIKPNNFIKVLEGNYNDKKQNSRIKDEYKSYAEEARAKRFERIMNER